jgi:hypothetical protein
MAWANQEAAERNAAHQPLFYWRGLDLLQGITAFSLVARLAFMLWMSSLSLAHAATTADAALQAQADGRRLPTYAECQKLADPKVPVREKIFFKLSFFPHKALCEVVSNPFMINNVFNRGETRTRLRFLMGKDNRFYLDPLTLANALLPDRDYIPRDKARNMLQQTATSMVTVMAGTTIDPEQLLALAMHLGRFAGDVGRNAEVVEGVAMLMRRQHNLNVVEAPIPAWLGQLKKLADVAPNTALGESLGDLPDAAHKDKSIMGTLRMLLHHMMRLLHSVTPSGFTLPKLGGT